MSITDELRKWAKGSTLSSWTAEHLTAIADRIDAALRERYIELPMDADGVLIHIGDMMECDKLPNGNRVCGEVKAISNDCVWLINVQYKIHAKYLHHHHEPTVEDVLREFGEKYCDTVDGCAEESELFAEYAARLQLRGEDE